MNMNILTSLSQAEPELSAKMYLQTHRRLTVRQSDSQTYRQLGLTVVLGLQGCRGDVKEGLQQQEEKTGDTDGRHTATGVTCERGVRTMRQDSRQVYHLPTGESR